MDKPFCRFLQHKYREAENDFKSRRKAQGMKKIALLISLLLLQVSVSFAQQPTATDSAETVYASVKMLLNANDTLNNDLASCYDADTALANIKAGSDTAQLKATADKAHKKVKMDSASIKQWTSLIHALSKVKPYQPSPCSGWIVFGCILAGFIFMILIWFILYKAGFKLSDALSENSIEKITIRNRQYSGENINSILALIFKSGAGTVSNPTVAQDSPPSSPPSSPPASPPDSPPSSPPASPPEGAVDIPPSGESSSDLTNTTMSSFNPAIFSNIASLLPPTIEVSDLEMYKQNTQIAQASPPAISQQVYRPSSSRLIAFMTSMFTLVIGMAMCCFFIYQYMYTGSAPDMSALTTMLITLGIGVTPYAFNKVAGALKGYNSDSKSS